MNYNNLYNLKSKILHRVLLIALLGVLGCDLTLSENDSDAPAAVDLSAFDDVVSNVTESSTPGTITEPSSELPQNPSLVNPRGRVELYSFTYKEYDNTYRPRWPSYFANELGIGPGSYTTLNGEVAEFRSYDVDEGARRPSYTIPGQGGNRFSGDVLAILHTPGGVPVAWIVAPPGTLEAPLP